MMSDFSVFILTNKRPDRVFTYETLRKCGYTGRIVLVIDDEDPTASEYIAKYGTEVHIFNKKEAAKITDSADNSGTNRGVVYARNMCHEIAKQLGIKYFIELDDDYKIFWYRFDNKLQYTGKTIKNLDKIFAAMLKFTVDSGAHCTAMAQGGDYIGGSESQNAQQIILSRKAMNSFVCVTDRPFKFLGRINEDTTAYTNLGSKGLLMFTTNQISLGQLQTQQNPGGLSEQYLDIGTYVKSFYTVMFNPSSAKVAILQSKNSRLHHQINWKNTTPCIMRESYRK